MNESAMVAKIESDPDEMAATNCNANLQRAPSSYQNSHVVGPRSTYNTTLAIPEPYTAILT